VELRRLLAKPDTPLKRLAAPLANDAALAAHVLRVANSAYYAGSKPVADLGRAVVRLGSKVLNKLLLVMVVAQTCNAPRGRAARSVLLEQWNHSTLVAALADVIGRGHTKLDPFESMMAGLIHDVGALPVLMRGADTRGIDKNPQLLQALVEALHCEIGGAILTRWAFPESLVQVATDHEVLDRISLDGADHVDVVVVANLLAHAGTDHRLATVNWSQVAAMGRLGLRKKDLEAISEQGATRVTELRGLLKAG
jgi:HD-like signal output (HDOD) protein